MLRSQIREAINNRPLTDFVPLTLDRKAGANMYICPVCGSGTGKGGKARATGGLAVDPRTRRVTCFAGGCFGDGNKNKGTDTLGALEIIWGMGETDTMYRAGYTDIDEEGAQSRPAPKKEKPKAKPAADWLSFYRDCHKALLASPEGLNYLHARGISDESIERWNLGYCAEWRHPSAPNSEPTPRIIVPRTKESYMARLTREPKNDYESGRKKPVTKQALFNADALDGAEVAFVVEGEFDAISLYQAGAPAVVALGSLGNAGDMRNAAVRHPAAVYVLALDNDKDKPDGTNKSRETQETLERNLKTAGLTYISLNPAEFYGEGNKDANDVWRWKPDVLKERVAEAVRQAQEVKTAREEAEAEAIKHNTGDGMLDDFLTMVTDAEERYFEEIPTGIADIDKALQGGFIRKTLVTLGAPPAMGKTALAQWIFENIAQSGHDVLYINLEMSREQLLARSLSRVARQQFNFSIDSLSVLRGYAWTGEQREKVMQAADWYRENVARNFVYNPDGPDGKRTGNTISDIKGTINREVARLAKMGRPAPLICIDYLQLVDGENRDAMEGLKQVIFDLKQIAVENSTVVLLIIANNRASNKTGTVEMESGRDTSAIEYSGDAMLGISYTAIENEESFTYKTDDGKEKKVKYTLDILRKLKRAALDNHKPVPAVCKRVTVRVLKSRFTEPEAGARMIFDGKHSLYYPETNRGMDWDSEFEELLASCPFVDD